MVRQFEGIICAVRHHGENGAIVRLLTPDFGLVSGYVRGARSRIHRPILICGNGVAVEMRQRAPGQLAGMTIELVTSRAPLLGEPLASAAIDWSTALVAATLPEDQPHAEVYSALSGLLMAVDAAPSARRWAGAVIGFERLMLFALGYGGEATANAEDWPDVLVGLNDNGIRLGRHLLSDRRAALLPARERLVDRLKRAVA
jgi:DNA repair protein RecO (recombination protein O)